MRVLFDLTLRTQQFPVAAAHQREAALHEANGSIAEIVRFPGVIRNALLAEEPFGDRAISAAGGPSIERANGDA